MLGAERDTDSLDASGEKRPLNRRLWRVGCAVFAVQLVILLALDHRSVARWNTTSDLGGYAQSWELIAHGHANPYSTIFFRPFWRNHFEIAMWPLSLLYWLHHNPETLKWVQSIAMVAGQVVGLRWVLSSLRRQSRPGLPEAAVVTGYVILQVSNPQLYGADWFDFHFEALASLFVISAAYALYNHRAALAIGLSLAALSCGDVAGMYVAAVGLVALLFSQSRRTGLLLVVMGFGWVVFVSVIGANQGSALDSYRYLAQGGRPGVAALMAGLVIHPHGPLHVLMTKKEDLLTTIRGGGVIGICSPWTLTLIAAAVVPAALSDNPGYLTTAFQVVLAALAAPIGAALAVDWVGRIHKGRLRIAAGLIGLAAVGSSLAWSVPRLAPTYARWYVTTAAQVKLLNGLRASVPADAGIMVSENAVGGFAFHPGVVVWGWTSQSLIVAHGGQPIYFIFVDNRLAVFTPTESSSAATYVKNHLHAAVVAERDGVHAYRWAPSPGTTVILIPRA